MSSSKRVLIAQAGILAFCLVVLVQLLCYFPFPSPIIKPFLPARLRWPGAQIETWVESGNFDRSYLDFFARDPERDVPAGNNMVSPSDGMVASVPIRDGTLYLVIALSFWDVHVVRTPVAGTVKSVEQEGYYLTRRADRADLDENIFLRGKAAPVQQIVTLDTGHGEVRVRLITSYWASRLKVWVHEGQKLEKGERIGRILLGSTVVAEVPSDMPLNVKNGQRVVGGETIIWNGEKTP